MKILAIEKNAKAAQMYINWFRRHLRSSVIVVENVEQAVLCDTEVDLIVGEGPRGCTTESFVNDILRHWPDKPIIIASDKGDILHALTVRKSPRIWAITKPFYMVELAEIIEYATHPEIDASDAPKNLH